MNKISKETFKEILTVLKKHKISYTTEYEHCEYDKLSSVNKHIHINLVIPNYYEEE